VAARLGVAERRGRLAGGLERGLPRRLRVGAGARGGQRVMAICAAATSAPASRRRAARRRPPRAARRGALGQRLADGVAHDRVREREVAGPSRDDQPGAGAALDRAAATRRAARPRAHEVGDREAPGDRARPPARGRPPARAARRAGARPRARAWARASAVPSSSAALGGQRAHSSAT
jgi:hypothetical protein